MQKSAGNRDFDDFMAGLVCKWEIIARGNEMNRRDVLLEGHNKLPLSALQIWKLSGRFCLKIDENFKIHRAIQ